LSPEARLGIAARNRDPAPELALDVHSALFPSGGIGRYVRDLAAALSARADAPPARFVYPSRLPGGSAPPWPRRFQSPLPGGDRRWRWTMLAGSIAGLAADGYYGRPTLVHSPAGYGPRFRHARHLVTVHDLTALTHPEWHSPRTAGFFARVIPATLRSADRIVCDSEWTRHQVLERFPVDPGRVETIHLGLGGVFRPLARSEAVARIAMRFALEPPYVLHVGTLEPRKNHVGLLAAFEDLRRAGYPGRLVLVGRDGWRVGPILDRLASSPAREAVLRVPEAADEDLVALYSACDLFVFPSFDEGFGFPPLEAMACGAPVVTSPRSALLEVVGDAARLVDPEQAGALGAALVALWRDESARARLSSRGPAQAARFTAERWISRMFGIYREMLAGSSAEARSRATA
jgi:glycosyltransferase involved in cell wall biosynthesis